MEASERPATRRVPLQALIPPLIAPAAPIAAGLLIPDVVVEYWELVWLLALVPAFPLAYYGGWKGAATGVVAGIVVIALTYAGAASLHRSVPDVVPGTILAVLVTSVGIAWLAERLHRDRAEVENLAFTDNLTLLPNRRHARLFLENEFAAAQRGRELTIALFDLDNFKSFNDRYGHAAGDEALRAFGDILSRNTRSMNLSSRFGGEEFLSILAGSDAAGALGFAERVRVGLSQRRFDKGFVTVSAGVAEYQAGMRSPDELLAAADHALYRAKREGRNCVRLFGRPLLDRMFAQATRGTEEVERALASLVAGGESKAKGIDGPPPVTLLPHQTSVFGAGRRVLLVEDDESMRTPLATYLTAEGFTVVEAADAHEATRELSVEFDVVITDIRLPGPSGTEVVAAVKARWPATQAVVITGVNEAKVAAQALNAGADRYLLKPFGLQDLHEYLVDALDRRDQILRDRAQRRLLSSEALMRAEQAHEAILKGARALVRAVEVRDPYTRGHSERVARYAQVLATALLGDGYRIERDSLCLACELHDVGKIGIPDAILNKDDNLTAVEFEEVAKHPRTGRRILESLLDDETVLSVVSWHHERWDGDGYPDRLEGEAIPRAARVVAVVDTLDAMTSTRAYRPALPWDVAVEQIVARAGAQFDPDVVRAFERTVPNLHRVFAETTSQGRLLV